MSAGHCRSDIAQTLCHVCCVYFIFICFQRKYYFLLLDTSGQITLIQPKIEVIQACISVFLRAGLFLNIALFQEYRFPVIGLVTRKCLWSAWKFKFCLPSIMSLWKKLCLINMFTPSCCSLLFLYAFTTCNLQFCKCFKGKTCIFRITSLESSFLRHRPSSSY